MGTQSFAQKKVQFGVKGGLNLSKISQSNLGDATQKLNPGYAFGGLFEFNASKVLALESGLFLSSKGTKLETTASESGVSITGKYIVSPLYVELPVNLVYKLAVGTSTLRLFLGSYFAVGVGGTMKDKYSATGLPAGVTLASLGLDDSSTDITFGSSDDSDLARIDGGYIIGAGYQMKDLIISAQYGLGTFNLDPSGSSDNESKNRVIGISVGYLFGGK